MTPKHSCTSRSGLRKKRWATEAAAQFVAAEDSRQDGKRHRYYKCDDCGGWHTTTIRDAQTGRKLQA